MADCFIVELSNSYIELTLINDFIDCSENRLGVLLYAEAENDANLSFVCNFW